VSQFLSLFYVLALVILTQILTCVVPFVIAMVAFLKAMIFMAIEIKYCVMIMKARMQARGTNVTQDEIRKKTSR
jgi:hypothetical protein